MLIAVIVLGAIALVAAAVLFVCSKKFAVKEAVADSLHALVWPTHW